MTDEPKTKTSPPTFVSVARLNIACVAKLVRNLKLRKHLDRTDPDLLEAFDDAFDAYGDWATIEQHKGDGI